LLYAAQAIDFRRPLRSTPVVEACHALVREHVAFIDHDRIFADDINALHRLVTSGALLSAINNTAIANHINLNDDEFGIY
jgi:histidine ammonia-lyase